MDMSSPKKPPSAVRRRIIRQAARTDSSLEQTSGFFTLSAELRNLIYDLLDLRYEDALWVLANRHSEAEDIGPCPTPPPIAQVCQLLRAETLPIFYSINVFSISPMRERNVRMAKRWVQVVGPSGGLRLRRLRLRGSAWTNGSYPYPQDISVIIAVNASGYMSTTRQTQATMPNATFSIATESQKPNEQAVWVARRLREMAPGPDVEGSAADVVEALERIIETFASFCTFRNERPPQPLYTAY